MQASSATITKPEAKKSETPEDLTKINAKNCFLLLVSDNQTALIIAVSLLLIFLLMFVGQTAVIIILVAMILYLKWDSVSPAVDKVSSWFSK